VAYAVSILIAKIADSLFIKAGSHLDVIKEGTSDLIILDVKSKPNICMLTPPKFANDHVSGIEHSSRGCVVKSALAICRKVQRFFGPTCNNRWLSFSGKRTERTEQTKQRSAKGHFVKVACLVGFKSR